jgi:hypothetical protein
MTDRTELERQIAELQAQLAALPEVDPLLVEAREIAAVENEQSKCPAFAADVRQGNRDRSVDVRIALAALRRGMELTPRAAMDDAAVEALARECLQNHGYERLHTAEHSMVRDAIRATLSRVPAAAWPDEMELKNNADEIARDLPDSPWLAALEMARRLKAHMLGGAA